MKKKITTKKADILKARKTKKSVRLKTLLGGIQSVHPHTIGLYCNGKNKKKKSKGSENGYRGVNASSASYNRKKKK